MASKRWSLSRVLGNPQESTSTVGSSALQHSNSSRNNQPHGSQQQKQSSTRAHATTTARSGSSRPAQTRSQRSEEQQFSSPTVPNSLWFASDFMLGAGMAIIQPSSGKVVVLCEKYRGVDGQMHRYWFLPKGRKDAGESLEQTALREAYEESGFRVSLLPIVLHHNAPEAPGSLGEFDRARILPCTEPIYISTQAFGPGHGGRTGRDGEYLTFWYVGQIPEDATFETGTRMADEVGYKTYLLSIEKALSLLEGQLNLIMYMAYESWRATVGWQSHSGYKKYVAELEAKHARVTARSSPSAGALATNRGDGPPGLEEAASDKEVAQDAESQEDSACDGGRSQNLAGSIS